MQYLVDTKFNRFAIIVSSICGFFLNLEGLGCSYFHKEVIIGLEEIALLIKEFHLIK